MDIKDLIRPPFANYDIVVYFGCGLFCLPLIHHYLVEPNGLRFPRFQFEMAGGFADTVISTLSLLFAVYILGHMVAYGASYIIEKTVDKFLGKVSSAIIIANLTPRESYRETLQAWFVGRFRNAFRKGKRFSAAIRLLVLTPVWPALLLAFVTRSFDYFKTRVPPRILHQLRRQARRRGYGPVGLRTKWYKAVEHDVINNSPMAVGRMYNYLVINGIFRSLSFIFLVCAWAELIYWLYRRINGVELVQTIMSDEQLPLAHFTMLVALNILFAFSISAYIKFSRRYAEEAIFAFVLSREPARPTPTPND